LVIGLSLIAAFYIDQSVEPQNQFVSTPFVVPVLIAAYRLPMRATIVTAMISFVVAVVSAQLDGSPFVPMLFHLLGLLLVSTLAILLGHQRRVAAQLAGDAQDLYQRAEAARTTLDTIIETMPAGVVVSDPHGTITLANTTAHTIIGTTISVTGYGPPSG